jgi:hypothetical protein
MKMASGPVFYLRSCEALKRSEQVRRAASRQMDTCFQALLFNMIYPYSAEQSQVFQVVYVLYMASWRNEFVTLLPRPELAG